MDAVGVDPRDTEWENQSPVYRVYFWAHPGHASSEWRLSGAANVHEVVAWAEERAGQHRTYQVWVEARHADSPGLILLRGGDDPISGTPCE